jgi:hypothetical protein
MTILVSIGIYDINREDDYIMIHSLIMCLVSYVRLHKACKLYGVFLRSQYIKLVYFLILAGCIIFLITVDIRI